PPPPTPTLFPYTTLFRSCPRNLIELPRGHVAEIRPRVPQFVEVAHAASGLDRASERSQSRRERVRDALRSAAGEWPVRHMRRHSEYQRERRGKRRVEREHRVRGQTREERSGAHAAKCDTREQARGKHARQAKPRHDEGMPR